MSAFLSDGFLSVYEGAIRSGKSHAATLAFLLETQQEHQRGRKHIVAGRNLLVMNRELMRSFEQHARDIGAAYTYSRADANMTVDGVEYFVVAGHDANSYKRVRSMTAGCALVDEGTLVPEDFFEEVLGRLSYDESKCLVTCNPKGKRHWLKANYIDKGMVDHRYRFSLHDNPTLGSKAKSRYHSIFSGVFHGRNILGEWQDAEGLIFSQLSAG